MINPVPNTNLKKYPDGAVYQWWGENPELYLAATGIASHNGLDIVAQEGTPILAAHNAIVFAVKDDPTGYGKNVQLVSGDQGGFYYNSIYGHCRNIIVQPLQAVVAGQQIAEMSNTGFVISGGTQYWNTAPEGRGVHLHFGVRIFTDPIQGTWQTGANGMTFTIKDYSLNGMHGWVNPMQFLNTMTFYKVFGGKDVYIIKDGKKTLVYNSGAFGLIGEWNQVENVEQGKLDTIPDSGLELAALVKE